MKYYRFSRYNKRNKRKKLLTVIIVILFLLSSGQKSTISVLSAVLFCVLIIFLLVKKLFNHLDSLPDNKPHSRVKRNVVNAKMHYAYEDESAFEMQLDNVDAQTTTVENKENKTYGYQAAKSIATETEKAFYDKLKLYCKERGLVVNLKTRLEDLVVYAKGMDYATKQKYRGQIKSRHVDYLIVNDDLVPVFAIELDDASHSKKKAMETDAFKDSFFNKIGIKLYRIAADDFYWKLELEKVFIEYDELYNSQNISNLL